MKIALEYIKYRWKAKRRHGIHSPFVFAISDKALQFKVESADQRILNGLFTLLKSNSIAITIQDFGAGSRKLGKTRRVSDIFRSSSSKGKYGVLLYQLCRHYKPDTILEFGTSLGVGTIHMALGAPKASITTVEACPETRRVAEGNFQSLGLDQVRSVEMQFSDFLSVQNDQQYDLIFIDGHHDGEALLKYMEALRPFSHDQTLFILDDIRWSPSMLSAWESLKAKEEFHVSIDFFRFGLLIRRPEQQKEDFILLP